MNVVVRMELELTEYAAAVWHIITADSESPECAIKFCVR